MKKFWILPFIFLSLFAIYKITQKYFRVVICADGAKIIDHTFKQKKVSEWLTDFNIQISSQDLVVPALDQTLRRGQTLRVVRVKEEWVTEEKTENFTLNWKRRLTQNLRLVELQNGYRKVTTRHFKRILHDGKEVDQTEETIEIKKVPVERLALLDKRGFAEQVYDLTETPKMRLTATAYWLGDPKVPGSTTFSGHKVERGLVAVDPKVIPLRQRLYIPGYGYAYSSDTGSAIKGKRIDLFVNNMRDSYNWEYNKVTVYILEKSRDW